MKFSLSQEDRLCWETNFHASFALMNILKTEADNFVLEYLFKDV